MLYERKYKCNKMNNKLNNIECIKCDRSDNITIKIFNLSDVIKRVKRRGRVENFYHVYVYICMYLTKNSYKIYKEYLKINEKKY